MAAAKVHYEVFVKKHRKAGWALVEARPEREDAIEFAQKILEATPTGSVRVSKERFDEAARAFRSFTIWEEGAERFEAEKEKTGDGTLPCLSPDDLTNPSARDTMSRVLNEWFVRKQVTPMELMHSPLTASTRTGNPAAFHDFPNTGPMPRWSRILLTRNHLTRSAPPWPTASPTSAALARSSLC